MSQLEVSTSFNETPHPVWFMGGGSNPPSPETRPDTEKESEKVRMTHDQYWERDTAEREKAEGCTAFVRGAKCICAVDVSVYFCGGNAIAGSKVRS